VEYAEEKRAAADRASRLVESGMIVGLGSGSTAELAIRELGKRVREGLHFRAVPTSEKSAALAVSLGIQLTTLEEHGSLDLAIDGADEVDPNLDLIKGHGGALLREKIVAAAARRFIVIIDRSKLVQRLGERSPLPVEVVPFGWSATQTRLGRLGLQSELRVNGGRYVTDGGNFILDCHAPPDVAIGESALATEIKLQAGVVDHGVFLGMTTAVIVGQKNGAVEELARRV